MVHPNAVEHVIQQIKVKTMANFSFLELSYDPSVYSSEVMSAQLEKLGFIHRSQHKMNAVGFWNHKECIFLVRKIDNNKTPYISGIGLLGDISDIEKLDAEFDRTSDFFKASTNFGLNIYIIQENQIDPNIENSYMIVDSSTPSISAFNNFTGIKLSCFEPLVKDCFVKLGFSFHDVSENYAKLISPNKKFTIMCFKDQCYNSNVPTILVDTHDVFKATAYFTSTDFHIPRFDLVNQTSFGDLDYKINAYNCKAWGNKDSYTIENFLNNVFEGLDIIFRQRKQYLHIHETTLDSYYIDEKQ